MGCASGAPWRDLPGLLIVIGVLPFWSRLRLNPVARSIVAGVNASVVGILGMALYDPLWTTGIRR
jgi:chromate transporter